jgi:membrane-bound serine protease (ClpP class)
MSSVDRRIGRWMVVVLLLSAGALGGASNARAASEGEIVSLDLRGVVDPFMASYIRDGIASAGERHANAVILEIDTPGGFDSSMRTIVQSILGSDVPVIGYVSPSGARAASAGTFVLMACPVAAMAPGTNVGAAHPVGVSGAIESAKVENDAVAYIRALAEHRGRNAAWAERAVRDSVSVPAEEAVNLNVIDLVAADRGQLLQRVDGRTAQVVGGRSVVLHTVGVPVVEDPMGILPFVLHSLITPDFAFLFFILGLILLVIELLHPGVSVPGILGALLLVFSLISFGMLPIELAGIVMLVIAVVLFLIELKHPGLGLPAIGGVIFLSVGALFLFDRAVPSVEVSPWLIAISAVVALVFFGIVVRASLRARHLPPPAGLDRLVGQSGVVVRDLNPVGVVRVAAEEWSATSTEPTVPTGAAVRVVGVRGLRLEVEPLQAVTSSAPASPGEDEGSGV